MPSKISPPILIVLTGPSGVGKDAVVKTLREHSQSFYVTVTATTRSRRPGEFDGIDYLFTNTRDFRSMVKGNELLEWAEVYGNLYGVPKKQVLEKMAQGQDVIIKTDIQGASTIKSIAPDALFIFLAPPNIVELKRRLTLRMTESEETLAVRLRTAELEMVASINFEHIVVNYRNKLGDTVRDIETIVAQEHKIRPKGTASLTQ